MRLLQTIIKRNNGTDDLVKRAFEFAKRAHRGQKRVSGEDFFNHPLMVAESLRQMGLDGKTIAAGLLHDVPEDTQFSLQDIEKEFGKEVALLVEGVSKLGKLRYPKTGVDIRPIKEVAEEPIDTRTENLRKMFFAMAEDLRVILIKLADRLHNMKTLGALPPDKQRRIALETLEIFAPLANRLGVGEIKGQLEDLAFPYLYPKEYEWLTKNVKEKYEERQKYLERVKPVLTKILTREDIKPLDLHARSKHYWSLYQKLLKYDMNVEKIYDLVALRMIVGDIETCYRALGTIHKHWRPLPGRIKDYIAFPKPNTYRSIHTTCFCFEGKITEIQIKTPEMHTEAEYGIAAHWARKEGVNQKLQQKKFSWVAQLRDWQEETKNPKEFWEGLRFDFFKNRIFAVTPRGDVIDLPEDATPIDFAYSVHSEVGNRCSGAKVNGKLVPLSYTLQNGDVVEILTSKSKKPSRDWLEIVKTNAARSRVRDWLKKESQPEAVKMREQPAPVPLKPQQKVQVKERVVASRPDQGKVFLAGQAGIMINLAKCCQPQENSNIKAYITQYRGASIHLINCQNLQALSEKAPQKIIEASWSKPKKETFSAFIKITAEDRLGLLKDISAAITGSGINILSHGSELRPEDNPVVIDMQLEVSDPKELNALFSALKKVRGIKNIQKV